MSKWAVLHGRNENWNLLQGSEKNKDKICIGYYSFLFSHLIIHSYKTCSPQPWIIHHFFSSSRKVSRRRVAGKGTAKVLLVFVYFCDWCGLDVVKVELFMQVILSLTHRQERGYLNALFSPKGNVCPQGRALQKPHLALQSHLVTNLKVDQSFSLIHCPKPGKVRSHWKCQDQSQLWLYIRII